jgi:hypothetical protein
MVLLLLKWTLTTGQLRSFMSMVAVKVEPLVQAAATLQLQVLTGGPPSLLLLLLALLQDQVVACRHWFGWLQGWLLLHVHCCCCCLMAGCSCCSAVQALWVRCCCSWQQLGGWGLRMV